jgi:phosphodiesterase/alkaline phosphatase D-like protein
MSLSEYPSALGNPFTLGVASGDPLPDGVVLWTRLAPKPLNGGGMDGQQDIAVDWEVATDVGFRDIVQTSYEHPTATMKAKVVAEAKLAHSVHLEVVGLESATRYYYRFIARGYEAGGCAKTAPEPTVEVPSVVFAFANCQSWQGGLYPVYRHIAQDEELDLVVHLGDYIYESEPAGGGPRVYETPAPTDLVSFRNRHAEYKTDPDLQDAHAAHPWVVTWDDHDVENDYAGTYSWYISTADFAERRAAAYQAYYEHMPLRPSWVLGGQQWKNINLYCKISYESSPSSWCSTHASTVPSSPVATNSWPAKIVLEIPSSTRTASPAATLYWEPMTSRRIGSKKGSPPPVPSGTSSPMRSSCSSTTIAIPLARRATIWTAGTATSPPATASSSTY